MVVDGEKNRFDNPRTDACLSGVYETSQSEYRSCFDNFLMNFRSYTATVVQYYFLSVRYTFLFFTREQGQASEHLDLKKPDSTITVQPLIHSTLLLKANYIYIYKKKKL